MTFFKSCLEFILQLINFRSPSPKLPEFLFLIGTFYFPQINVELIIRDSHDSTIYTWRDDEFGNIGWHLPGGIVRPNESMFKRITNVIDTELPFFTHILNTKYKTIRILGLSEIFREKLSYRSHFVSLIFLIHYPDFNFSDFSEFSSHSTVSFSKSPPSNLINNHLRYKDDLSTHTSNLMNKHFQIYT